MIHFLSENMGTLIIGLGIFVMAALAARSVYRTKKKGGCSHGCGGCSRAACHHTKE